MRPAPQTCSLLFAVAFLTDKSRRRPWGNSWVQPHLRRNSLKRLTRRRKHLRRGPASRRIHELVQLGENLPAGRGPKNLWMPLPNGSNFSNSVHAWPRTLLNNVRFGSVYGLSPRSGLCPSGHSRRLSRYAFALAGVPSRETGHRARDRRRIFIDCVLPVIPLAIRLAVKWKP